MKLIFAIALLAAGLVQTRADGTYLLLTATNALAAGITNAAKAYTDQKFYNGEPVSTKTANYTVLYTDIDVFFIFNSATNCTVTFADGATNGFNVTFKNLGAGSLILTNAAGKTFDSQTSVTLPQNTISHWIADGTNYRGGRNGPNNLVSGNKVFASPSDGSSGLMIPRVLVAADLPTVTSAANWTAIGITNSSLTGTATLNSQVVSNFLSLPTSVWSVVAGSSGETNRIFFDSTSAYLNGNFNLRKTAAGSDQVLYDGTTFTLKIPVVITNATVGTSEITINGPASPTAAKIVFNSGGVLQGGLFAPAANTYELRNSTAAQTVLVGGTFTDTSNYRRGKITDSTAGVFDIGSEGLGTGATGNAIRFLTDGSARWTITSAGNLISGGGIDNTYDIGASGATRPRAGYFGTSVSAPTYTATIGFGSTGTGTITTSATGGTNTLAVNVVLYVTAATGASLTDNAGTTEFSGVTIANFTPVRLQPGGKFTGTAITYATGTSSHAW